MVTKADQDPARVAGLVEGWKAGVEADRRELARVVRPLVVSLARRSSIGFPAELRDDIEQAAWIGVAEAIYSFDPERNVKFWTWATWQMRKQISIWQAANGGSIPLPYPAWQAAGRVDKYLDQAGLELEEVPLSDLREASQTSNIVEILEARKGNFGITPEARLKPDAQGLGDDVLENAEMIRGLFGRATLDEIVHLALDLCDTFNLDYSVVDRFQEEYETFTRSG